MKEYTIEIRNGKYSTYRIREKLKRDGFYYKDRRWYKKTDSRWEIFRWKHTWGYCCLVYDEQLHERGKNYRQDYFAAHKPVWNGKYHCAYCGKLLPKNQIAVDHMIPVQKAKASKFWQNVLKIFCNEGVNDPKNLVGTCQHCNSKKGVKTSFWILRGLFGRSFLFWICLKVSVFIGLGYLLVQIFMQ